MHALDGSSCTRRAGVEPVNDIAPSADRIVCRGRAGEGVAPPRASVSDGRQPTEREEAAAGGGPATSQGGVWIRIASSGRADEPGQRTVSSASLAWRALCLLADAPMLPGRDAAARGHWAQLRRDPRPLPPVLGSATQVKSPVRSLPSDGPLRSRGAPSLVEPVQVAAGSPSPAELRPTARTAAPTPFQSWYRWTGDAFEAAIATGDVKLRHLARDPRCVLVVA